MEKYINPTERVANKLYEYITQTDEGKKKKIKRSILEKEKKKFKIIIKYLIKNKIILLLII